MVTSNAHFGLQDRIIKGFEPTVIGEPRDSVESFGAPAPGKCRIEQGDRRLISR